MREQIRMIRHNSKFQSAITIACLGLMATMVACSSDDSGAEPDDAGNEGAVVLDSAAQESSSGTSSADGSIAIDSSLADTSSPDTSSTVDAGADHAVPSEASVSDAAQDVMASDSGTVDAAHDASADAASTTDSAVASEADAAPSSTALQMCILLDTDWGIATDAGGCATTTVASCPDRPNTWSLDITMAFSDAISNDCRISAMFSAPGVDGFDYANELLAWNLALFGCPDPDVSPPPLKFGLIPSALSNHVFTTADLKLFADLYVSSLNNALSAPSSATTSGPLPALTTQQIDQIRAQLASLAAAVPGTVASSAYSFDSCPADAGTDGQHD